MKKIAVVQSFKGGTGKTVIAANFAHFIASKGMKTLLIDADLIAPSVDKILVPAVPLDQLVTWTTFLDGKVDSVQNAIYKTKYPNLDVVYSPPPEIGKTYLTEKGVDWWGNSLRKSIRARETLLFELGYDWIVFDNQNGVSMNSANNLIVSDVSVLVVRPVSYGIDGTLHLIRELYGTFREMKKRYDYIVWNQVPLVGSDEKDSFIFQLIDDWDAEFDKLSIPSLGRVPYQADLSISMLKLGSGIFEEPHPFKVQIHEMFDIIQAALSE
ncbi:MAG: ParA family protein [Candidatus Hodarchaeales archaeon]|jgi:cellulose biosynthesis protein BcsQ